MKGDAQQRIYRYVVRYDLGTAPNPYDGYCTLALCKPGIRRAARINDWIMGFRSRQNDKLIYVMQISEVLTFAEYWEDVRFANRKPGYDGAPTDNIYKPKAVSPAGEVVLKWVPNETHEECSSPRDLSGKKVLVGKDFWYFGDRSPPIPDSLKHLIHHGQAYTVHKNRRPGDVLQLEKWLRKIPSGRRGNPVDQRLEPQGRQAVARSVLRRGGSPRCG